MRQAWPAQEPDDRGLVGAAIVAVVFIAGVTVGWLAGTGGQPDCPQEDSCVVDYSDGHWMIVEVTP